MFDAVQTNRQFSLSENVLQYCEFLTSLCRIRYVQCNVPYLYVLEISIRAGNSSEIYSDGENKVSKHACVHLCTSTQCDVVPAIVNLPQPSVMLVHCGSP